MSASDAAALVVPVAELVRHPGSRRHVDVTVVAGGLALADAHVPDGSEVTVAVDLESLSDGITVVGFVRATWEGQCRRCLGPASGPVVATVGELYQRSPTTDEAFEFDGDHLDLAPLVRENLLVELPMAPLCRPDCAGLCPTCGVDRNSVDCGHDAAPVDLRWAALEQLRDDLAGDEG